MILLLLALAHAEIGIEGGAASVEQPTVVTVLDAQGRPRGGETVRVVYRPALRGEREAAIGITDSLGRVHWTPEIAGVAEVRAGDERLRLRIGWPGVPLDVAVLLGLLALAGAAAGGYGVAGRPARR